MFTVLWLAHGSLPMEFPKTLAYILLPYVKACMDVMSLRVTTLQCIVQYTGITVHFFWSIQKLSFRVDRHVLDHREREVDWANKPLTKLLYRKGSHIIFPFT